MKRYDVSGIALALLLGSLMGFVPLVMMRLAPTDHVLINALKFLSAFTMVPGLAAGMVAAQGKIDDISLWSQPLTTSHFIFGFPAPFSGCSKDVKHNRTLNSRRVFEPGAFPSHNSSRRGWVDWFVLGKHRDTHDFATFYTEDRDNRCDRPFTSRAN
jgi:hypothetical protein